MGVTLSDTLDTPYFALYGFKLSYDFTDYILTIVCLKQAILALFRILRINKNPLICRRDLMWAVQDSNLRPPGCKLRAEHYFINTYKITDSCLTLVNIKLVKIRGFLIDYVLMCACGIYRDIGLHLSYMLQ